MEKMNEFEAQRFLMAKGSEIQTTEDVKNLVGEVITDFNYDYGVAPRSISAAIVAIANYMSRKMGITGFQAGFVMWGFIKGFMRIGKCGLKLVDYDDMLYPQYEYKFVEKKISKETWKNIQKQAKINLEENEKKHYHAGEYVVNHWKSIVDGNVPFGYEVEED